MPLSQLIQRLIHLLEVGAGARYLRYLTLALVVFMLGFLYDIRAYRNLATPEAMDAAQLARNISEGKGYTTQFIRPFSLYLVQNHNEEKAPPTLTNTNSDFARIKTEHPDISNPPVYPLMLAGLMKVRTFHYPVELKKPFWSDNSRFYRYQPDFLMAIFNEVLLLIVVALTFFLAKNLFDSNVAWLSAVLVLGCELLWRFSVSGLPTILLLVIFLGLTRFLLEIEKNSPRSRTARGPAAWPSDCGGSSGRHRRADALRVRLGHHPGRAIFVFVQRPAKVVAYARGAGHVRDHFDTVDCPQRNGQRHGVRHGRICDSRRNRYISRVSTRTFDASRIVTRAVALAVCAKIFGERP